MTRFLSRLWRWLRLPRPRPRLRTWLRADYVLGPGRLFIGEREVGRTSGMTIKLTREDFNL